MQTTKRMLMAGLLAAALLVAPAGLSVATDGASVGLPLPFGASSAQAADWSHKKNLPSGTVCAPIPGKEQVKCTTPDGKVYICQHDGPNAGCTQKTTRTQPAGDSILPLEPAQVNESPAGNPSRGRSVRGFDGGVAIE